MPDAFLPLHAERREAGEPVTHERLQDEEPGVRRGTPEDRGEGAEGGHEAGAALPLQGQDRGQGHAGHPRERARKETRETGRTRCHDDDDDNDRQQ